MLEVAVIGAGTSGLVAARHLLGAGLRPTIFEAAKTVGGAWTPHPSALAPNNAGKMWHGLRTNLSKYTMQYEAAVAAIAQANSTQQTVMELLLFPEKK